MCYIIKYIYSKYYYIKDFINIVVYLIYSVYIQIDKFKANKETINHTT